MWLLLTLLSVVLSTSSWAQLLWRRSDQQKTWVTFRLFMVFHVSPLSLSNWWASVVRVRSLMLWPGCLIPEPSSRAVLVAWRAVTTPSTSWVAASVSPSVCGADTRHVGPLGHHLQTNENKSWQLLIHCWQWLMSLSRSITHRFWLWFPFAEAVSLQSLEPNDNFFNSAGGVIMNHQTMHHYMSSMQKLPLNISCNKNQ